MKAHPQTKGKKTDLAHFWLTLEKQEGIKSIACLGKAAAGRRIEFFINTIQPTAFDAAHRIGPLFAMYHVNPACIPARWQRKPCLVDILTDPWLRRL